MTHGESSSRAAAASGSVLRQSEGSYQPDVISQPSDSAGSIERYRIANRCRPVRTATDAAGTRSRVVRRVCSRRPAGGRSSRLIRVGDVVEDGSKSDRETALNRSGQRKTAALQPLVRTRLIIERCQSQADFGRKIVNSRPPVAHRCVSCMGSQNRMTSSSTESA